MYKIGIIGTGRIAKRFVAEVSDLIAEGIDISISGVFNPRYESSARFARENHLCACEVFGDLLSNSDIVYIASPHETHYEYAKVALERNKHVLCEKPMCFSKFEAEELYALAKSNDLVLFEGLKTAFCPGFNELIKVAQSGKIGEIKYIDACFTKLEDENKRELTDVKFGGSFTELGSYVLLPVIKLFDCDFAEENVQFDSFPNKLGIDIFTRCTINSKDQMATLTCGLGVKSEGRLLIAGTKGYIIVPAPWWKTSNFEIHYEDASVVDKYESEFVKDGLRYEIRAMLDVIKNVEKAKDDFSTHSIDSVKMASVFELFMKNH